MKRSMSSLGGIREVVYRGLGVSLGRVSARGHLHTSTASSFTLRMFASLRAFGGMAFTDHHREPESGPGMCRCISRSAPSLRPHRPRGLVEIYLF